MKKHLLLLTLVIGSGSAAAQKFVTEKSSVVFFSKAPIEDISATNSNSTSIFNESTGDVVFVIPIQNFEFEKALMKEHFNEKYMDTEKFPKATFQGKITGFNPKASGKQNAVAKGKMTIHGVTKEVEIPGTMEVMQENIGLTTKFIVKLADYNISIPTVVFKHIAEQIEVTAQFTYKPQ